MPEGTEISDEVITWLDSYRDNAGSGGYQFAGADAYSARANIIYQSGQGLTRVTEHIRSVTFRR